MATSKVEICNQALSLISQEPIVTIDAPTTANENLCAKWYEQVRRHTLSMQPWNFAKKRALAVEITAPAFGYDKAFQLPSDYIRIIQIGETRQDYIQYYKDYDIAGNEIQINFDGTGNLPIIYTRDVQTVVDFSPWFVDLLAIALAIKISNEITRTATERQILEAQYQEALKSAKQLEGQESPIITIQNSKFKRGIPVNAQTVNIEYESS